MSRLVVVGGRATLGRGYASNLKATIQVAKGLHPTVIEAEASGTPLSRLFEFRYFARNHFTGSLTKRLVGLAAGRKEGTYEDR